MVVVRLLLLVMRCYHRLVTSVEFVLVAFRNCCNRLSMLWFVGTCFCFGVVEMLV